MALPQLAPIVIQFGTTIDSQIRSFQMTAIPGMVWMPADHRLLGDHGHQMPFLLLGDKYARAVKVGAQAQPVMFPLADAAQSDAVRTRAGRLILRPARRTGRPVPPRCAPRRGRPDW